MAIETEIHIIGLHLVKIMKEKVIKCSREVWDKMRLSLQCKLFDIVEVIDKKEGGEKEDVDMG